MNPVYSNMSKSGYVFLIFLVLVMLLGFTESDARLIENKRKVSQSKNIPALKTGDIIFQTSLLNKNKRVQLATKSIYSHVGLIYKEAEEIFVLEAVQPVQLTPFNQWVSKGENDQYAIKRLKDTIQHKKKEQEYVTAIKNEGAKWLNKEYNMNLEWTDGKVYCSELVWKIYKEAIGVELTQLKMLTEFGLDRFKASEKLQKRIEPHFPSNQQFVSPGQLFESEKLELVFQN